MTLLRTVSPVDGRIVVERELAGKDSNERLAKRQEISKPLWQSLRLRLGDVTAQGLGAPRVLESTFYAVVRESDGQVVLRGQVETMQASFLGLTVGLAMAIVLVYLLIVVNFQSWVDAGIIIAALPAALAGIAWMLFITGTTLSVPALTGAIMTMGVATANSILVVSFALQQQAAGAAPLAAALEAGATRIRPVLMTALAMIIGMIPMALALGEAGEQNAPLGRAVIGGLLAATLVTLFVVPVVYALLRKGLPTKHLLESRFLTEMQGSQFAKESERGGS
mgnify:CR=1 FL=1